MAKEKGNILYCLRKTMHHVSPHKVRLMAFAEGLNIDNVSYRFRLVEENVDNAIVQLQKVIAVAKKAKCQEVLDALNEEIEVGHNFPEPESKSTTT